MLINIDGKSFEWESETCKTILLLMIYDKNLVNIKDKKFSESALP